MSKQRYSYTILNPGGNVTAFIDSPVERDEQPFVAETLLRTDSFLKYKVEQVGFIEMPTTSAAVRLQMASGELCLNATRCLAAFHAELEQTEGQFVLETSGYETADGIPIEVRSETARTDDARHMIRLNLDPSTLLVSVDDATIELFGQSLKTQIIRLSGITHVLAQSKDAIPALTQLFDPTKAGLSSREVSSFSELFDQLYLAKPALAHEPAVGFILYEELDPTHFAILPLVKVNKQNTIYYETACGSATVALAATRSTFEQDQSISVMQPSGSWLQVSSNKNEGDRVLTFHGDVVIVDKGTIEL